MSVTASTGKVSYNGNDVAVNFAIPFLFLANADLLVTETVIATGVDTVKTLTTHYTVVGATTGSGTLTMLVAPASTVRLTIQRVTPKTQATDYVADDAFNPDTVELDFDKACILIQEMAESISRCLQLPATDASAPDALPSSVDRADTVLGFDANGDPELVPDADSSAAAAAASAAAAAVDAAAASASAAAAAASAASINPTDFLTKAGNLSGLASTATSRTNLGLGSAATLTAGTAANNVVQLDGTAKLPAVDGSQLTNLPATGVFTLSYTPAAQTITADSDLVLAHGLGVAPKTVDVWLECLADNEGYTAGKILFSYYFPLAADEQGVVVEADATNVTIHTGSGLTLIDPSDDTWASKNLDLTKWAYRVRAYA